MRSGRSLSACSAAFAASTAAFAAACSGTTVAPIANMPVDVPQLALAPPPIGARWIDAGGATVLGPMLAEGRMVLLGGRRAIVGPAGARAETAPSPEPLEEIVEVPVGGARQLFARGAHTLFRLPDPLGAPIALTRSSVALARLGAAPGVAVVWTEGSDLPRFVDAATGKVVELASMPSAPPRAIAFADDKRGAAVFAASGLAVTSDGGATWKLARDTGRDEALRVTGLARAHDGTLRGYAFTGGPDAEIDVVHAAMAALHPQAMPADEAPLLRWVRTTGRDPLEVAAGSGLDTPKGALVASHGLLARIDLHTGLPSEVVEFARGRWMNPCAVARAGESAFVACSLSEGLGDLFDPFGLLRVPLTDAALKAEKPLVLRNGEAELRTSSSGGAMLLGPCTSADSGVACVKQPDGAWITIAPSPDRDVELEARGAGPLVDGSVAFLRGLPQSSAGDEPIDEEGGSSRGLRVAALDKTGKERTLLHVRIEGELGDLHVESPIEEDESRALHFILARGNKPYAVVGAPGKEAASARAVPEARVAYLHAGRGVALSDLAVLTSLDGGTTWNKADASPRILDAIGRIQGSLENPAFVSVSEVGVRIGSVLRIGWGPGVGAEEIAPSAATELSLAPRQPAGPELVVRCTSEGAASSTPPPSLLAQFREAFATREAKDAKKDATRRETSTWINTRWGPFDAPALLEVDAAPKSATASKPATWTFRWLEPLDVGDHIHAATLAAPSGDIVVPTLKTANASSGRALFSVKLATSMALVRVRPGAPPEVREVAAELAPSASGDVVFGEGRGEPVAWLHDTALVAWFAGEAPRIIARVAVHGARHLGEPTKDGIPIFVGTADWALWRTIAWPARPDDRADAVPLDGWTKVAPLSSTAHEVSACGPRDKGVRFWMPVAGGRAEIDGASEVASTSVYELRIAGDRACVASVAARLVAPRTPSVDSTAAAHGKGPTGPVEFVRADLTKKRAEGGNLGAGATAGMRRMTCALAALESPAPSR